MKTIIKTDCDKRGHDLYLGHNDNGKIVYKCMYCTYTKPISKKSTLNTNL